MSKYKFINNYIGSDNWCQVYFNGELMWESSVPWSLVEDVYLDTGSTNGWDTVEVEWLTDEEMDEICS